MQWHQQLLLVFKDKQLRNKIIFVLGIFVVFRIAANIPISGVNLENLRKFFNQNQMFGLVNMFVGGTMAKLSIVMLGVGPYITAIIIIQLLTMIFPALEKLYKEEGEAGRQKFNQYGRLLTVPLAFLQGYAMLILFQRQGAIAPLSSLQTIMGLITIAGGSVFLMWLGELITEKGIGNGVSLLIFAGIIDRTPAEVGQLVAGWSASLLPSVLLFFAMAVIIIASVVLITEARRNIPVSYAKRVRGNKVYGGASTYLPVNINPAGVIPIIFALSILLFPSMIAGFFANSNIQWVVAVSQAITKFLQNPWVHGGFFFVLVFAFTYFYTAITFDPKSIANNLQKMGGFVPGIRPGNSTADFLHKILYRTLFLGAFSLGLIAIMPSIIQGLTGVQQFQFLIGGTSLLIVVSVVLETWRQVKSQIEMREYDTY